MQRSSLKELARNLIVESLRRRQLIQTSYLEYFELAIGASRLKDTQMPFFLAFYHKSLYVVGSVCSSFVFLGFPLFVIWFILQIYSYINNRFGDTLNKSSNTQNIYVILRQMENILSSLRNRIGLYCELNNKRFEHLHYG